MDGPISTTLLHWAWLCASILQNSSANKSLRFEKFNMVANCHLENEKIMISQNNLHRIQQNFSVLMHNGPPYIVPILLTWVFSGVISRL